jgi:adenylate cyclase
MKPSLLRLPTVRAKLTALVATTVLLMVATLPVLSWLLHRQLIDEVDDRVEGAARSFEQELKDDIDSVALAAKVIAADADTRRFLVAKDSPRADDLAQIFVSVYPDIDILLAGADGQVLAQVGCKHALAKTRDVPVLDYALQGSAYRGLTDHGCEAGLDAPPAYTIALPIKDGHTIVGVVIVCLPIDQRYLANASAKLGLELGLMGPPPGNVMLDSTAGLPAVTAVGLGVRSSLVESRSRTFATTRFEPPELRTTHGYALAVVAAMDVTDIRRLVQQNLFFALGVLLLATIVSVAFGTRLAHIMSGALKRVNDSLKKLAVQEYAHIEGVNTGDELEDLAHGFNLMVDGLKERDKLRNTFGKYMTASVVAHLMSGKVALGGETLTVTILFTDIRSFTTISEKMDAQALVGLLNEYFTEMVGAVTSEDGVVDKYIGDAIMAVFGAPVPKPDDAVRAVRAAVKMRAALVHLNARLATRGIGPLQTGVGIHTGEVVAGNIGTEHRMEYTVIGDAVNVASRLESSTKDLHVGVLISDDTWAQCGDQISARPVKEITVKGRAKPVMAHEVLGIVGEPPIVTEAQAEGAGPSVAPGTVKKKKAPRGG